MAQSSAILKMARIRVGALILTTFTKNPHYRIKCTDMLHLRPSVANTNLKGCLTELKNPYLEQELPTDSKVCCTEDHCDMSRDIFSRGINGTKKTLKASIIRVLSTT